VRHARRVEALDELVAADLDVEDVADLRLERGEEVVERRERRRVARARADVLARAGVEIRQPCVVGAALLAGSYLTALATPRTTPAAA
jgi:hypothetical protein